MRRVFAKGNRGLSLVELVVVTAIIGLLVATTNDFYTTAKIRASRSEARTVIHTIVTTLETGEDEIVTSLTGVGVAALWLGGADCPQRLSGYFIPEVISLDDCQQLRYTYTGQLDRNMPGQEVTRIRSSAYSGHVPSIPISFGNPIHSMGYCKHAMVCFDSFEYDSQNGLGIRLTTDSTNPP